jgi:hypothetical protein
MATNENEYHGYFNGCLISTDGCVRHFINGAYGRDNDLPAVICPDGTKIWYQENPKRGGFGQSIAHCHRDGDKPAVIKPNGDVFYYLHGKLHRENGQPAYILSDGTLKWFIKGNCVAYQMTGQAKKITNTKLMPD